MIYSDKDLLDVIRTLNENVKEGTVDIQPEHRLVKEDQLRDGTTVSCTFFFVLKSSKVILALSKTSLQGSIGLLICYE